jgi:AraC family transcriptional regulator
LAKIAVELEEALAERNRTGAPGRMTDRVLAQGNGWTVYDIVCTSGPQDRPFQESHAAYSIAMVVAGTFQYRGGYGRELMTPGSLLLGNVGHSFECSHDHGAGDRCISFGFTPEYFEGIATDSSVRPTRRPFRVLRVPPLRDLAPIVARACSALVRSKQPLSDVLWEELALRLAAETLRLIEDLSSQLVNPPASAISRVTRVIRQIESRLEGPHSVASLATTAGLSPYHFLRTFQGVTGITPHQYLLRSRLREAALRLASDDAKILDVAFDSGFGDISNFNRTFRAEFGCGPRAYRQQEHFR